MTMETVRIAATSPDRLRLREVRALVAAAERAGVEDDAPVRFERPWGTLGRVCALAVSRTFEPGPVAIEPGPPWETK